MDRGTSLVVVFAIIILVVGIRMWRATREQRFGIGTMWVTPAIFLLIALIIMFVDRLTSPLDIVLAFLALVVGAGIGLYQGTHTSVRIDRASRAMFVKMSPFGAAIFVAVLAGRIGIRAAFGMPAPGAPGVQPLPTGGVVNLVSMMLLFLAVGTVAGLRIYLNRVYNETR